MADYEKIDTDPGVGASTVPIALHDIAGEKAQVVVLDVGDGTGKDPVTKGQKTMLNSVPVVLSSDQSTIPVRETANTSTTSLSFTQAVKTVAATGTPERLVGVSTKVQSVILQACKGFNSPNASDVFIGSSASNDGNFQRLQAWEQIAIEAPPGKKVDLNEIFIDVVMAGDGIAYWAMD